MVVVVGEMFFQLNLPLLYCALIITSCCCIYSKRNMNMDLLKRLMEYGLI